MKNIVLIVSTARTGSTSLLRVINSLPKMHLSGENGGLIINLIDAYVKHTKSYCVFDDCKLVNINTWHNHFSNEQLEADIKSLVLSIFNCSSETIGFKEVRWYAEGESYEIFEERLLAFVRFFPNTKIILNIRENIDEQAKSLWWNHRPNAATILHTLNDAFIKFNYLHPSYLVTLEDIIAGNSRFTGMFDFIGATPDMKAVETILNSHKLNHF